MENVHFPAREISLTIRRSNPYNGIRPTGVDYSWSAHHKSMIVQSLNGLPKALIPAGELGGHHGGRYLQMVRDKDRSVLVAYLSRIGGARITFEELETLARIQESCEEDITHVRRRCLDKLLEIEEMCQDLVLLEEIVEDRQRLIEAASSATAPIRRLPVELLLKIFKFTTTRDREAAPRLKSALLLSSVCKLWRSIVINESTFWCHLSYEPPQEENDLEAYDEEQNGVVTKYKRLVDAMKTFAERSGTRPLKFSIVDSESGKLPKPTGFVEKGRGHIFDEIRSCFPKCSSLHFTAKKEWASSLLQNLSPAIFTTLEELNLDVQFITVPPKMNVFSNSPLRVYHLLTRTPLNLARIIIPQPLLESFSMELSPPEEQRALPLNPRDAIQFWRYFINKCVNLQALKLKAKIPGALYDGAVPRQRFFIFSGLRKLSLCIAFRACASTVLRGLDLPALDYLHLSSPGDTGSQFSIAPAGEAFMQAIYKDIPFITGLQTLSLTRIDVSDHDLQSLLRAMTRLQFLSVLKTSTHQAPGGEAAHHQELLSSLTISKGRMRNRRHIPLVPTLQCIRLSYNDDRHATASPSSMTYITMAVSRYRWNARQLGTETSGTPSFERSLFKLQIVLDVKDSATINGHPITLALQKDFGPVYGNILRVEGSDGFKDEWDRPTETDGLAYTATPHRLIHGIRPRRAFTRVWGVIEESGNAGYGAGCASNTPQATWRRVVHSEVAMSRTDAMWDSRQIIVVTAYIITVVLCTMLKSPLMSVSNRAGFLAFAVLTPVFTFFGPDDIRPYPVRNPRLARGPERPALGLLLLQNLQILSVRRSAKTGLEHSTPMRTKQPTRSWPTLVTLRPWLSGVGYLLLKEKKHHANLCVELPVQVVIDGLYAGSSVELGQYDSSATFVLELLGDVVGRGSERVMFGWCKVAWLERLVRIAASLLSTASTAPEPTCTYRSTSTVSSPPSSVDGNCKGLFRPSIDAHVQDGDAKQ
ncbi:hypothetical protein NLJ89_g6884 [Agrocybe chaxingu]|uniref:F-box domain-containing protein n=1 Tax=Agrocybe chaxingu TaxID=84603 RepID=A0A9W8JXQ8_9AGAR|nr:hypothetical protein NLJ89_g6884 [Agrocybe chaxingu]